MLWDEAYTAESCSEYPLRNKRVETEGVVIHRVRGGKIVEYLSVTDVARVLQQLGVMPGVEQ